MTLANLRSDTRFLIFGDSTNTQYGDTDLDRNANAWYRRGIAWILKANGDWQVNGEIATANIVASQREYILPTDILKLNEVYIKYDSSGEYIKATQRDPKAITVEPDQSSYGYYPSKPEFDLTDNSIMIYIPETSISAITAGLKIHYQTEITALSETTDAPNIAEPFERLISYGSAYDYCLANEMGNKAEQLKRDLEEIKIELIEFYATRSTVKRLKINPKTEVYE